VRGVAYSGGDAAVARVEVSGDGGETWVEAQLDPPTAAPAAGGSSGRWTWRIFACDVEVRFDDDAGVIIARAFDDLGAEQPPDAEGLWNFKGYMNNAWPRVAVRRR